MADASKVPPAAMEISGVLSMEPPAPKASVPAVIAVVGSLAVLWGVMGTRVLSEWVGCLLHPS